MRILQGRLKSIPWPILFRDPFGLRRLRQGLRQVRVVSTDQDCAGSGNEISPSGNKCKQMPRDWLLRDRWTLMELTDTLHVLPKPVVTGLGHLEGGSASCWWRHRYFRSKQRFWLARGVWHRNSEWIGRSASGQAGNSVSVSEGRHKALLILGQNFA